jgi:hypothetical protein
LYDRRPSLREEVTGDTDCRILINCECTFGKIFCIFRREIASMTNLNPGGMETTSSFTSKTKKKCFKMTDRRTFRIHGAFPFAVGKIMSKCP